MPIKIAIVDDHELFREGISGLLEKVPDFVICGVYEQGKEFIKGIETKMPDIVLMDIEMPQMDGETATRAAILKYPELKIIILSMFSDFNYYHKMLSAGVKGFILKEARKNELEIAIKEVYNGSPYFSQVLLQKVITNIAVANKYKEGNDVSRKFSEREIKLIELLCKGLSNKEISDKLFVSHKTVESDKTKLFEKTGVKTSAELVAFALKNKIIVI
ncbi:MAG TPA: response regulator transcription factor [Bacteroidales bacterium]